VFQNRRSQGLAARIYTGGADKNGYGTLVHGVAEPGGIVGEADWAYLSLDEVGARLRARDLSPVELTRAVIDRTERLEPVLGGYITFTPEAALDDARRAEREILAGQYRGPLHGVPVAVKDLLWTKGVRTTFGSRVFADFVPEEDATAVARLRLAGAVLLGKTNISELCWDANFREHAYAIPRNPWNTDHYPGISSAGSAVVVAAGLAYGAIGSDSGGSIRHPATFCGVTGLKPTYGRVSLHGAFPLCRGLDHIGPMARSVLDCALLLDVLAGHDPRDPESLLMEVGEGWAAPLRRASAPLRIGVPRAYFWEGLPPHVGRAAEEALDVWRSLGWPVREVDLPPMAPVVAAHATVIGALIGAEYGALVKERGEQLTPQIREKVEKTLEIPAAEYINARRTWEAFAAALDQAFEDVDLLVTPTRAGTAPRMAADGALLEPLSRDSFRSLFNLPGVPAMSIPCGFDDRSLPIGIQIVGPRLGEAAVLSAGHAFQSATDWHRRRPRLDPSA
jgi:aspartyl-tRNA(Asn)/glutamyl-tRNA(Gln) amidotransferase subunit A